MAFLLFCAARFGWERIQVGEELIPTLPTRCLHYTKLISSTVPLFSLQSIFTIGNVLLANFLILRKFVKSFTLKKCIYLWCAGSSCCLWALLSTCCAYASHCRGFSFCSSWSPEGRLSSCGVQASLPCDIWDLPDPGIEPVFPALQGRFLTIRPPGKPHKVLL